MSRPAGAGDDSDLDSYIREFEDDHEQAWEEVKRLVKGAKVVERSFEGVAETIQQIRDSKKTRVARETAETIVADLESRGAFYHDGKLTYFFDATEKSLLPIVPTHAGLQQLLFRYGIVPAEEIFRYVWQYLGLHGSIEGEFKTAYDLAYFDAKKGIHYLSNHDNQIIRTTSTEITTVDNGTDGVMFKDNPKYQSFTFDTPDPGRSLLDKIVIGPMNFAHGRLTPDQNRLLWAIWLQSLLFDSMLVDRPILLLKGEKGSGKSVGLQKIGMMLLGGNFKVTPLPTKEGDFVTRVTSTPFTVLDNVDSRKPWLNDRLAVIATGGSFSSRALYTDNDMLELPITSQLALTARTPEFRRDDVADRLIILEVDRFTHFAEPKYLYEEVLQNRDVLMSELVVGVQETIRAFEAYPHDMNVPGFRMAGFGSFAMRIAAHASIEQQMQQALQSVMSSQTDFTTEDDPLLELFLRWVDQGDDVNQYWLHSELRPKLLDLAERQGLRVDCLHDQRAFGSAMRQIKSALEETLKIDSEPRRANQTAYRYRLKDGEYDSVNQPLTTLLTTGKIL